MNITIDREILLENLNVISRGLPAKSPMPILTGIKFEATDSDLYLTSSNTDISVEVLINDVSLEITEPGKTVVPGKFFIEIIRKINSKKVNLYLIDDKILVIRADRGEYKLHIMDYMDYPNVDFVCLENPLKLDAQILKKIIKETVFATAASEKKPILTGVNFKNEGGKLIATATDSFRLSQKIISIEDYNDFNITIPNKSLDELLKAIDLYDDELSLYKYKPKKLSLDLYDTTELWSVLLELNNMYSVIDFCKFSFCRPSKQLLFFFFKPLKFFYNIDFKFRTYPHCKFKSNVFMCISSTISSCFCLNTYCICFFYKFLYTDFKTI